MAASKLHVLLEPNLARMAEAQATLACITARNDTESPLLRLPGEVRNLIYGFVFTSAPYNFTFKVDKETGDVIGIRTEDRPLGIDLTRVCRKLHEEIVLLPFILGEFHCLGIKALAWLHYYLLPEQQKLIRKLTVEVKIDDYCSIDHFLAYTRRSGVRLSNCYSNLGQVLVLAHPVDYSATWQQNWPNMNAARVRIMQDNKMGLEDWLRDGAKEGFQVMWKEMTTKQGAWE